MKIKISKDYSKTPGGRFKSEGAYSGEDFRESILFPKYNEAKKPGILLLLIWTVVMGMDHLFRRSIWRFGKKIA